MGEVKEGLNSLTFNLRTMFRRLDKYGDIAKGILGPGIDMRYCLGRIRKFSRDKAGKRRARREAVKI